MSDLTKAQVAQLAELYGLLGPLRVRHCPLEPTPRQEAFLRMVEREVLYGGAAGGGKSVALLIAALQYVDVPGYHALLLRPSLAEFHLPGGLIELAADWLAGSKVVWSGEHHRWTFPGPGRSGAGGATLSFGYLDSANDVLRYSGISAGFLGFDELTRFSENAYLRTFRALRQPVAGSLDLAAAADGTTLRDVPIRIRATSNPGGPGHSWVKNRFVRPDTRPPGASYLPSRLTDNPHLDAAAYMERLAELPPAERLRLQHGDWDVDEEGELFARDSIRIIEGHDAARAHRRVRYWDLAATTPSASNRDPDYTVGLLLERDSANIYTIRHIVRGRWAPAQVEQIVAQTAREDGRDTPIKIEQEGGASGKLIVDHYKRNVLTGYSVYSGLPGRADKQMRARPVAAAAANGYLQIVPGPHLREFLDELALFPNSSHDDCVDALSGAYTVLAATSSGQARISVPRGRIPTRTMISTPAGSNRPLSEREAAALEHRLGLTAHRSHLPSS